jgi:hypothetical protein
MSSLAKSKPGIESLPRRRVVEHWIDEATDILVRRNRLDFFLATFPLFAVAVATAPNTASEEIARAVDYGFPAIDAISSAVGVKKSVVRFLRGKCPTKVGLEWVEQPAFLLQLLDHLAPHQWPSDQRDWESFNSFYYGAVRSTSDPEWNRHRLAVRQHLFLDLCGMGYRNANRRLNRHWPEGIFWEQIRSFVRALEIWVWHQAVCQGFNPIVARQAEARLPSDLLVSYPAIKIHQMTKHWHHVYTFCAVNKLDRHLPTWPALIGTPVRTDALSVVSLVSRAELVNESEALNHCSWMYVRDCVRAATHIVSIRDTNGKSLSTAEIRLKDASPIPTFSVVQHRAGKNSEPSESCQRALSLALDQLSDPTSPNWIGNVAGHIREWRTEIEQRLAGAPELTVHDGIQACLVDALPDYSTRLQWVTRRLEDEEGLYRHRNDLAEEKLRTEGLADENTLQRHFDVGYFDPTVFSDLEEFDEELKGKNCYYESWAEMWVGVPFWYFHLTNRA